MKIKTFITTMLLFLLVFFSSLLLISKLFLDSQIDSVKERGMNEHYFISNSMGKELQSLMERDVSKEEAIAYLYEYYSGHYNKQKVYLEIYQGDNMLYSSFYDKSLGDHNSDYTAGNRTVILKKLHNKNFIVVNGEFPNTGQEYKIQYIYDVTAIMAKWMNMYYGLLFIGVGFSFIIAFALMFLLNIIFKPLTQIITVSKEIANGNYENRIKFSKMNELISLSESFNDMAEKVQTAITDLSNDAKQNSSL